MVVCMPEHHTSMDGIGVGLCLGVYRAVVLCNNTRLMG
jgi:hypothetical protein